MLTLAELGLAFSPMLSRPPETQVVSTVLMAPGKDICASNSAPNALLPSNWYSPRSPRGAVTQPTLPSQVQMLGARSGWAGNLISVVRILGALAETVNWPLPPRPS